MGNRFSHGFPMAQGPKPWANLLEQRPDRFEAGVVRLGAAKRCGALLVFVNATVGAKGVGREDRSTVRRQASAGR